MPAATAAAADAWTPQEIAAAKARCTAVLKGIDAVVEPMDAFKHGACGAPAPVKLIGLGNPAVSLSPPAILSCEMVAALAVWLKNDVQPLARKHLGSPVVKIENMSAYSCRNALGRTAARLSEHGRANALDIGSFATTSGAATTLLAGWGPTRGDIEAARTAAAAAAGQDARPTQPAKQPAAGQTPPPAKSPALARGSVPEGTAGGTWQPPGTTGSAATWHGLALSPPHRLGGAKRHKPADAGTDPLDANAQFLRDAHRAACRIFGTVLGPESNADHRNHFHLDMAERRSGKFCQ